MENFSTSTLKFYSRMTGALRPLPNFIIIGAQKAGTTSLFHYITQHPRVFENKAKEVHFFDKYYGQGINWYRGHFPLQAHISPGCRLGEATPYYLCHPHAPKRIHQLLPRVKLIAILRNPIDRAISHYFHEVKKNRENLPIVEALNSEDDRCRPEWLKMLDDEGYVSRTHQSFSYKQRGIYIDQLERYWRLFAKEQILVVDSEKLFTEPHTVLETVFRFLDIDPQVTIGDVAVKNANPIKQNVPQEVYDSLHHFFQPHNKKLYTALGQDFAW